MRLVLTPPLRSMSKAYQENSALRASYRQHGWCLGSGASLGGAQGRRRRHAYFTARITHHEPLPCALCPAPAVKAGLAGDAERCRSRADAM